MKYEARQQNQKLKCKNQNDKSKFKNDNFAFCNVILIFDF